MDIPVRLEYTVYAVYACWQAVKMAMILDEGFPGCIRWAAGSSSVSGDSSVMLKVKGAQAAVLADPGEAVGCSTNTSVIN